jgi:phosphomannomutase
LSIAFGTSGLRGLVSALTQELVMDYTRAFLTACPIGDGLYLGQDLRASSPDIARWIIDAALAEGVMVNDCGALPTPALASAAQTANCAAIMVTGSHIPSDRNGLKFYTPQGEITKTDEGRILAQLGRTSAGRSGQIIQNPHATTAYVERYANAFAAQALQGRRIGVYQHSSVARDIMVKIVTSLGGAPVPLGRSDTFIPVDTEALDQSTRDLLAGWCAAHQLDAIISTDGDADRPMLTDETGQIIKGDILGLLTARYLGAKVICTPISSNSMIAQMPDFQAVHWTKIGSPYVIAAMQEHARPVGFEANGGFLLGFDGPMPALMTRDAMLPILATLVMAKAAGLRALVAALPPRFTDADRLMDVDMAKSAALLDGLRKDPATRHDFFGPEMGLDETDGLRVTLVGGQIVHLRPSGNAPEFRCYTEADSPQDCAALLSKMLAKLSDHLG